MALTVSGKVYIWGNNSSGFLGIKKTKHLKIDSPQPLQMNGIIIKSIACGQDHSLLLSSDGDIYAFGSNKFGQLGLNDTNNRLIPTQIPNIKAKSVICGYCHTIIITI